MAEFPTPTVVRIKRRLGTEASENIIVQAKKKRLSEEPDNPVNDICTTILRKLTTLKQGDCVEIEAKKALLNEPKHSWELKESFKARGKNSSPKDLIQRKTKSQVAAIRFKLICARRDLDEEESKKSDNVNFHLFDALKESEESSSSIVPFPSSSNDPQSLDIITCNGAPMKTEKIEYVYDLYYTSLPMELSSWIDGICEIQRTNAIDFYYENGIRNAGGDGDSEDSGDLDDDDDENEESNWRNDYPDEEETMLYQDEDDYLCDMLKETRINEGDSDESYDLDNYESDGDFDENGDLICSRGTATAYDHHKSVFARHDQTTTTTTTSSTDSDDD